MSFYQDVADGKVTRSGLERFGFRPWTEADEEGKVLMLMPELLAPVFDLESEQQEVWVESIDGEKEIFKGCDRDSRFGCLAVGFRVKDDLADINAWLAILSDTRRALEQLFPERANAMMMAIERPRATATHILERFISTSPRAGAHGQEGWVWQLQAKEMEDLKRALAALRGEKT